MKQTYTIRMETKLHDMLIKISKKKWKTFSQIISDAVSGYAKQSALDAQDVPSALDTMDTPYDLQDSYDTPDTPHNIPQDVEKPKQLY